MYTRLLRSVLATAFSTVVAFGALSAVDAPQAKAPDSVGSVHAAAADSGWGKSAPVVPADSGWGRPSVASDDSGWGVVPADSGWGDATNSVPDDSGWGAVPADSGWGRPSAPIDDSGWGIAGPGSVNV
jgi:hypothetical protein